MHMWTRKAQIRLCICSLIRTFADPLQKHWSLITVGYIEEERIPDQAAQMCFSAALGIFLC